MAKLLVCLTIVFLLISCKNTGLTVENRQTDYTIENTIRAGGNYRLTDAANQKDLTPSLFSIASTKLNVDLKELAVFDLFENNTNYVWHMSNIKTGEYFRFICDKEFRTIVFNELIKSEIREELKLLNN